MPKNDLTSRTDVSILALEVWHVISSRTRNCLGRLDKATDPTSTVAGVRIEEMRLSDLSRCESVSVIRLPNLGRVCYCEIAAVMDRYGWRFHRRWNSKPELPALQLLGASLPRYLQMATQAAEIRRQNFARGERMMQLRDREGLSGAEIGKQFGITGAAASLTIQKTRRILELRARLPLPPAPAAL